MAIQQPAALAVKEKKIRILLAGPPGIGKTTLALSAPNPLLIDVDRGLDRVTAIHRKTFIQPANYEELMEDLVVENITSYDTLVFDTGGQLIKLMAAWAIRQDKKNGKRDGSLSLPGYGAVGREFERLINYCYYTFNKHIVVVFHSKEDKDGEDTRLRLLVEGQTKDNVWQPMDLGGFIEIQGNKRTIGLSNCERYYAKGTHGINGIISIPELKDGVKNDFLTNLFAQVNKNIAQEAIEVEAIMTKYDAVMEEAMNIIEDINTPEEATAAIEKMKKLQHSLTSEKEIKAVFAAKIKAMGYIYDSKKGIYISKAS